MSVKKLQELGIKDEKIRDVFWESNSDTIAKFKELGIDDDAIYKGITDKFDADDVFFSTEGTDEDKEATSNIKYLSDMMSPDGTIKVEDTQGFITPEDNTATMPIESIMKSVKQEKVNKAYINSYISGAKTLPIGVSVMAQDAYNWIRDFDDGFTKEDYADSMRAWAKDNQEAIDKYNKQAGFKGDEILTPDLFGQVTAEILALPAGGLKAMKGIKWLKDLKTTSQVAIAEGGLATVSAVGEGKDYQAAATSGVTTAIGTKVVGKVLEEAIAFVKDPQMINNLRSGKASDKQTLGYVIDTSGETPESINKFYESYAKATNIPIEQMSEVDKINAIIKNSESGTAMKLGAEYEGDKVLAETHKMEEKLKGLFSKDLENAEIPSDMLDDFLKNASKNYGEIKNAITTNFDSKVLIPKEGIGELTEAVRRASNNNNNVMVTRVLEDLERGVDTPLSVDELMGLTKDLNSLNISGIKGFKAGQVGEFISDLMYDHFEKTAGSYRESNLAKKLWSNANSRYAQKKMLEDGDNWLATFVQEHKGGKVTPENFAALVKAQPKTGQHYFNELRQFIGEDGTEQVEKLVMRNALEGAEGFASGINEIKRFRFSTEAGKSIREELLRIEGAVPIEASIKLLNRAIGGKSGVTAGMSDNFLSKVRYHIVAKTYKAFVSRLPSGASERAIRNLGDVLKKELPEIKLDIKSDPSLQKAFDDEIKILNSDIAELKKIGKDRTSSQNRQLAESMYTAQQMQKQLPSPTKATSKINIGDGKQPVDTPLKNAPSTVTEKTKPYEVDEVIEDTKELSEPSSEYIDTEIVMGSKKKLTEEQAKRSNEITSSISDNISEIKRATYEMKQVPKSKMSNAKKREKIKQIRAHIREVQAENVSLKKKIPKI